MISIRNAGNRRIGRTARIALLLALSAAIVAPAQAAKHYDCNPNCSGPGGAFEVVAGTPFAGEPSALSLSYSLHNLELPPMDVTYWMPEAWQFGFDALRQGEKTDGTKATTCTDVFSAAQPRTVLRAEALGAGVGMRVFNNPPNVAPTVYEYGFRNPSSSDRRNPSLVYLNTAADGTINLCMYLSNNSAPALAKEFLVPITLQKLPAGGQYGWKMRFSPLDVYKNTALSDPDITTQNIAFNSFTARNWGSGLGSQGFSVAPEAGSYKFRADFIICRTNLDRAAVSGCHNEATSTRSQEQSITITPPPVDYVQHRAGKITAVDAVNGTTTSTGTTSSNIAGTRTINVKWTKPQTSSVQTVRGYVVAMATPGVKASEVFRYFVTQQYQVDDFNQPLLDAYGEKIPVAGYDPTVCDAAGACSTKLTFPMVGIGGKVLKGEGKYDLALVTIYADGARSDGLYDPADAVSGAPTCVTGMNTVTCGDGVTDPARPPFKAGIPKIGYWSIFATAVKPTTVAVQTMTVAGPSGPTTVLTHLLLLDETGRHAQFVYYNAPGVDAVVYAADMDSIVDGVIHFGSTGSDLKWQFLATKDETKIKGSFTKWTNGSVYSNTPTPNTDPTHPEQIAGVASMPTADYQPFDGTRV